MFIFSKKQKKINIAHFLYDSPLNPWVGGGGSYRTIEIYKRFPRNFKITIICGNHKGKKIVKKGNIRFIYVGSNLNYNISRLTYSIAGTKFFKKNHKQFDLIINDFCCYSPIDTARLKNAIMVSQNFFGFNLFKKFSLLGLIPYYYERFKIKKFKNIIFSSNVMKNKFSKYMDLKKLNFDIIPYSVDKELFYKYQKEKEDYILFLGRIEFFQKGLDILIKAMKHPLLKDQKLIIAGTGTDEKKLIRSIKDHPNITYIGRVEKDKKYDVIRRASFLIMPSRYESFGIVAIEGAAACKPVIGFAGSGLEETIIHNKTGFLLKEKSGKALANAVYKLWNNKKLREYLSRNAGIFAQNFKWDAVTRKQLNFYSKVLKRNEKYFPDNKSLVKENINYTNHWWASNFIGIKKLLYSEKIHYHHILKFFKKYKKELNINKKLTDIGFGTGAYIKYLSKKYGLTTIGLDISEKTVELYNQRSKNTNSLAKVIDPYLNKLPFKNNEIDYIICSHLLEHVPDDNYLLKEIYRVIKKNGIIFFNIPINEEKLEIPTHLRKYNTKNFNKQLLKHGFKIISSFESDNFTNTINYLALRKTLITNILKKLMILILSLIPIRLLEWFNLKKSQYVSIAIKTK